jgi:D-lyxose ketol-isomerase
MKRSVINDSILHAIQLLDENYIKLPAFGYWKPAEWRDRLQNNKEEIENISKVMLGWDVTDFGSGEFEKVGATLFTVRNGSMEDPAVGTPYAEKYIFMLHATEQEIPFHFHRTKTEDIINRAGGILSLELYNSTPDEKLDKNSEIIVKMDGVTHTFAPGTIVEIEKGCSITLHPGLFHRIWAKKGCGDLIAGEVSSINDDRTDNIFLSISKRFAAIEEDNEILYLLCNEYEV